MKFLIALVAKGLDNLGLEIVVLFFSYYDAEWYGILFSKTNVLNEIFLYTMLFEGYLCALSKEKIETFYNKL